MQRVPPVVRQKFGSCIRIRRQGHWFANAGVNSKSYNVQKSFVQRCKDGQHFILSKEYINMIRPSFLLMIQTLEPEEYANLMDNANNVPLAVGGENLIFSAHEDKYLYLVKSCRAKGYGAKNHSREHMLSHSLHVAWDKGGLPKRTIGKSRTQITRNITL